MSLSLGSVAQQQASATVLSGPVKRQGLTGGPAGFDIASRKGTIYGSGNNLACWTPLPMIAKAVHNMLLPSTLPQILNRAIYICGVEDVTQNNILAALEAEIGSKFEVTRVDIRKIRQDATQALEKAGRQQPEG
ncbi:MAG: hypothetical protein Q9188_005624 [Gyalolechia gomerana]